MQITEAQKCEKKTTRKKILVLEIMRLLPVTQYELQNLDFRAGCGCMTLS